MDVEHICLESYG